MELETYIKADLLNKEIEETKYALFEIEEECKHDGAKTYISIGRCDIKIECKTLKEVIIPLRKTLESKLKQLEKQFREL